MIENLLERFTRGKGKIRYVSELAKAHLGDVKYINKDEAVSATRERRAGFQRLAPEITTFFKERVIEIENIRIVGSVAADAAGFSSDLDIELILGRNNDNFSRAKTILPELGEKIKEKELPFKVNVFLSRYPGESLNVLITDQLCDIPETPLISISIPPFS